MNKTIDEIKAVREEIFRNVPGERADKISASAWLGVGIIIVGLVMLIVVAFLATKLQTIDWKILLVLLSVPFFVVIYGANIISTKVTKLVFGSVGAIVRSIIRRGSNGQNQAS